MTDRTCSVDGCTRPARTRGWCPMHYKRWAAHGDPLKTLIKQRGDPRPACSVESCERRAQARGWCGTHWARWRRSGTVEDPQPHVGESCSIAGCGKPARTRGWCGTHYSRFLRQGTVDDPKPRQRLPCSIGKCGRPVKARGLCAMHYQRLYKRGSTEDPSHINAGKSCAVDDCSNPATARGLCQKHSYRLKIHGQLQPPWDGVPWGLKWCWRCKSAKRVSEFYVGNKGPGSPCKSCRSTADRRRRKDRPARSRPSQNRKRRARLRVAKVERYTAVEIADRDGWLCQICLARGLSRTKARIGKSRRFPHPRSLSIDHIIPIARGGDDVKTNVQAAHFACNSSKGHGGHDQLRLIG